jgi:hypothetical protein
LLLEQADDAISARWILALSWESAPSPHQKSRRNHECGGNAHDTIIFVMQKIPQTQMTIRIGLYFLYMQQLE